MNYQSLKLILTSPEFAEIMEAELAEIGFESFVISECDLTAYIQESELDPEHLNRLLAEYRDFIKSIDQRGIPHKNWNAVWESSYQPVTLDEELFIGAPFHSIPKNTRYQIVLEPNMSFGTGHHPTTEMVLRYLFTINLEKKKLMDFGCGSAILSIYAAFRGAIGHGVEIDPNAAEAARNNLAINRVGNFKVSTGGIEQLKGDTFDIIAANINRNIIEECLPQFLECLRPNGQLICSGFLSSDMESLILKLEQHELKIARQSTKEDWSMIVAQRSL